MKIKIKYRDPKLLEDAVLGIKDKGRKIICIQDCYYGFEDTPLTDYKIEKGSRYKIAITYEGGLSHLIAISPGPQLVVPKEYFRFDEE